MAEDSSKILATLDYNEQLILFYLFTQSDLVNQLTVSDKTGIYYSTVKTKLERLEQLGLVLITARAKSKMLTITEKGVNTIEQWKKTYEGAKIIQIL